MRILITDFFGIMAGSTHSALYLAEGLHNRGHSVWIGYKKGSFLQELICRTELNSIQFKPSHKLDLQCARQMAAFVKEKQIEVVNAQASIDRHIAILARKLFGMPGILIHTRRQKPQTSGGKMKARFYEKTTDKIIAVSPAVKDLLVKTGISKQHIEVILNGIPEWKIKVIDREKIDALKDRYKIGMNDQVIGCVGRIKKQDQILKAAIMIRQPLKIIFVGINSDYPHLKRLIKDLPVQHQVHFTGEIPVMDTLHHYPLFTVKILPSDMEGFSQSALEAMTLRIPVIATDACGNRDMIEHMANGLLFDDNNICQLKHSIEMVINQKDLASRITEEASKRVNMHYSLENSLSGHEDLYLRLINTGGIK